MSHDPVSRTPRIALIGVTGYAAIYLQILRPFLARGEVELVAVAIINRAQPAAAAAAAELAGRGAKIYETTEAFFTAEAGRVEVCLIPTGIAWHARLSVSAMRAGMHVLVEKPLAGSRADVELIRRVERETGRWVAVGFQDIYSEAATTLRAELDSGVIGQVRSVAAFGLWPRPVSYYTRNHWAGCLRADDADVLDSPLNNAFAHFVNLGLFFADRDDWAGEAPVFRDAELWRVNAIESFDTAVVRGRLAGDVRFWFGFSHATREVHEPEILLTGTLGKARWVHEGQIEIETNDGGRRVAAMPDAFESRKRMLRAVLARLRDPEVWVCDTTLAAKHTAFICGLHAFAGIFDAPGHLVEPQLSPEGEVVHLCVTGLGAAMQRAFATGGTLAGSGILAGTGAAGVLAET
jgi:predicted dehydrogenase